jgi:2-(1,2-epoxy-1,2-dihydrophenyl)acetyl-CoA isomerase
MKDYQTLQYRENEGVATITFNRPEVSNSINKQLQIDLLAAIEKSCADSSVRVVVLTGAGKNFCAGFDLNESFTNPDDTATYLLDNYFKPVINAIYNAEKPFICAINGSAAGVSSALAMTCDLITMADDAYIYQAFSTLSLIPDGGACWHLVQQLGYRRAYEMVIEAEKMPAQKCLELGLINRVLPAEQLVARTEEWALEIAKKAPLTLRYTKQAMHQALLTDLISTVDIEGKIQDVVMQSRDVKEGITAFFERRDPVFIGK